MHANVIRLHDPDNAEPGRLDPDTIAAPVAERQATLRQEPLPTTGPYPPLFAMLGAHGGAGTSTLTRWWAHAADSGLAWPASTRTTQRVVVAARDCIPGLTAAADRLREWHAGLAPAGISILGLVVTPARPGRVPAAVRRYRRIVEDLVDGAIWSIDWHDELIVCELDELAQFAPNDPPPPRRANLTTAVPIDVHRAGTAITARIAATRAHPDEEASGSPR
ncbi:hypothetical protein GFY24_37020 [Nocardia sp. SYP-A9097]|uniref:hypothetical protein n=1 Tax=Nocardia sp. SYP-A9097 TaxID=2663237 RepID=UPI00129BC9E9|nr:hypothetical protein [Nocardia sp. SYP-A9097]MRH92958.1 hypothetical protein [Nocardia sp. SYP-A9097]